MHVHIYINFQNNNEEFIYIFRHILKIYAFTPSAQNILSIKHCHTVFINQLSTNTFIIIIIIVIIIIIITTELQFISSFS